MSSRKKWKKRYLDLKQGNQIMSSAEINSESIEIVKKFINDRLIKKDWEKEAFYIMGNARTALIYIEQLEKRLEDKRIVSFEKDKRIIRLEKENKDLWESNTILAKSELKFAQEKLALIDKSNEVIKNKLNRIHEIEKEYPNLDFEYEIDLEYHTLLNEIEFLQKQLDFITKGE